MSLDIQGKKKKDNIPAQQRDKNLRILQIKGTALVFLAARWKVAEDMEQSDTSLLEFISLNYVLYCIVSLRL